MNVLLLPAVAAFLLYTILRILIQKKAAAKLSEEQLLLFSLFGEVMHMFLLISIYIKSLFKKDQRWK